MAKNGKRGGKAALLGPLYTPPTQNLGPHRVEGEKGGRSTPDPLGFGPAMRKGPGSRSPRSQNRDKE